MIRLPHLTVTSSSITISDNPMFSGGGTQPPPKPHAPVKKPGKKKKK